MAKKKIKRSSSKLVNIILSTVAGIVCALIILGLSAIFLVKNDIPPESVKFFWLPVCVISGFVCGLIAGKLIHSRGIVWGSLSSLILSVLVCLVIMIFNSFAVNLLTFVIIPITVLFGAAGGIISSNLK